MDISLTYALKLLLLPPTSFLILSFIGFFWPQKSGKWLSLSGFSLLWIFCLPITAHYIAAYWERFPVLQQTQLNAFKPEAIVVIGGGLTHHATEYGQAYTLNERTLVRLRYAAKLARNTGLPTILFIS